MRLWFGRVSRNRRSEAHEIGERETGGCEQLMLVRSGFESMVFQA